jgi:hemolysin III
LRAPVFNHLAGQWRPRWRGRIHAIAFACTIPAGIILVWGAPSTLARATVIVYVLSLLALFSTSAAYHLFTRSYRAQHTMQQLDHAMVYVLIAGTYTPVCVLALPRHIGIPFLVAIWSAAAVGMGLKFVRKARKTAAAMYIVIGWAVVAVLPWLYSRAGFTSLSLFALGGVAYTIGAVLFLFKRPRLVPHVFGYHEVWHLFTVLAGVLQFAAMGVLLANAA